MKITRAAPGHSGEDPFLLVDPLRRIAALGAERLVEAHRGCVADRTPLLAKADWTKTRDGKRQ